MRLGFVFARLNVDSFSFVVLGDTGLRPTPQEQAEDGYRPVSQAAHQGQFFKGKTLQANMGTDRPGGKAVAAGGRNWAAANRWAGRASQPGTV